jgi:hypothetical protein
MPRPGPAILRLASQNSNAPKRFAIRVSPILSCGINHPEYDLTMPDFPAALTGIAKQVESGERPERVTVRTLLEWFGAQRRGFYVVENIRSTLAKLSMRTDPDFESAFIDALVDFVPSNRQPNAGTSTEVMPPTPLGSSPVERRAVGRVPPPAPRPDSGGGRSGRADTARVDRATGHRS